MSRLVLPLLAAPVILLFIFFSLGLLFASLRKTEPDALTENVLLEPILGAAAALIITTILAQAGLPGRAWVGVMVSVSIAAAVGAFWRLGIAGLLARARILSIPLGLFLICYLALVSPLLARGTVGVTGYNVNNDSVVHVILADQLAGPGLKAPTVTSSFSHAAAGNINDGYPIGFHLLLALVVVLTGLPAFYLFNAVMGVIVALGVFVFYFYGKHLGMLGSLTVLAALGATLAYLTVGFAIQGFAPQVSLTPFLYAAMLGIYAYFRNPANAANLLFATMMIVACLALYSFTALLWLAPFGALVLLLSWKSFGFRALVRKSAVIVGCLVFAGGLSVLSGLLRIYTPLRGDVANVHQVGNLLGKISPAEAMGVWLSTDHRFLPNGGLLTSVTYFFAVLMALLAAVGALRAARGGRHFLWAGSLVAVGAVALVNFASGPYYFSKAVQLSSPAIILAALYGADGLFNVLHNRLSGLPGGAFKAMAATVLAGAAVAATFSDAAEARSIPVTPTRKLEELGRLDARLKGKGPALFLEKDDWGKYFLRRTQGSSMADGAYGGIGDAAARPGANREALDFDSLLYGPLGRFNLLVAGRDNLASLPSPAYEGLWSGSFYSVYGKDARLFSYLLEHKSVESLVGEQAKGGLILAPGDSRVVRFERPLSGASLAVGASVLPGVAMDAVTMNLNKGWGLWDARPDTAVSIGEPGRPMKRQVRVARGDVYDIYIRGRLSTGLRVSLAGARLSAGARRNDNFLEFIHMGSARLAADRVYSLNLSSQRPTPQSINYVQKVVLVARNRRDTAVLAFSGSRSGAALKVGMSPQVLQIAGVEAMAGRNRYAVALVNKSDLPVRLDWLEILSRPYPNASLEAFERFYEHNDEAILASF